MVLCGCLEAPPHPHLNTSKANQSKWHRQSGLRRKECCLPNALLVTVVKYTSQCKSLSEIPVHGLSTGDIFICPDSFIYQESQGQRRILHVSSFGRINITSPLPQLHASQWAVGPQGNAGAFRDTVLWCWWESCRDAIRVCHQQRSTALP